ncbi:hypothetical protein FQZ97_996570 [compost metagenome]
MPVAALAVGEVGIDRRIVQVEQFLAGIARVVLLDGVDDRERRTRAVALGDVARALVLRRAQRRGGLLRAQLVVDRDDLELHARRILLVELLRQELRGLELIGAHGGHETRQRVEPGDLDGLALLGEGR